MIPGYDYFEGDFQSRDHLKLHYRFFKRSNASETLFILHGHGEHSGRYIKFASHLLNQNLSIAMFDLRGYGLSAGEPCYVDRFQDYQDDFSAFLGFVERKWGMRNKPILLGHSNGGLVAVKWAMDHKDKLRALFLSSPYLGLKLPAALVCLNKFISRISPHFVYSNPVYPPFLTHNPEELVNYKKDTLMRRKITARLLSEMMKAHKILEDIPHFEFPFPVMILMAGLDRIVDPSKTRLFYDKLRVPCKDLRVFEGFYHEIYNELEQESVFEALRKQIDTARPCFSS